MVYKQSSEPRLGKDGQRDKQDRASLGGRGEYIFIFLVLKVPRKVNMNLKDKFIYLFTLCLFQKPLKVSYNMHNAAGFFF